MNLPVSPFFIFAGSESVDLVVACDGFLYAWYIVWYAKRYLSVCNDIKQQKAKPVALAAIELCLSEGISQLLTQSIPSS